MGTAPRFPPNMDSVDCDGGAFHRTASVLDGGSRRILGFGLSGHHDAEMAHGALALAITVRGGQVPGVIMYPTRAAGTPRAPSGQPARGLASPSPWAGPGRPSATTA